MKTPKPLPPILRSPAFSVQAARQAGVPAHRLRRMDLNAPFHGARIPMGDGETDVIRRCAAYRTVMTEGTFFSHSTAAQVYGLPLPSRLDEHEPLHVSSVLPSRAPKGRGVRGHALAEAPLIRTVKGMRVPEPVEVWCQLAAMLTLGELVIAGDGLMRRRHPLCQHEALMAAAARAAGRPGVRKLRDAAERVRPRTDSAMETVLRRAIVDAGLPEPSVNFAIPDRSGRVIASGDLVLTTARLVVEYDGEHHWSEARQFQTDVDRLYRIESLGWRVIRITKEHMRHGAEEALARIRRGLRTSGPDMPFR